MRATLALNGLNKTKFFVEDTEKADRNSAGELREKRGSKHDVIITPTMKILTFRN